MAKEWSAYPIDTNVPDSAYAPYLSPTESDPAQRNRRILKTNLFKQIGAALNSAQSITHSDTALILTNPLNSITKITLNNADTVRLPAINNQSPAYKGKTFIIFNGGDISTDAPFQIVAQDGTTIIAPRVEIGEIAELYCLDDSTANGTFITSVYSAEGSITRRIINGGNVGTDIPVSFIQNCVIETSSAAAFTASAGGTNGINEGISFTIKNNSANNYATFQPTAPNTVDGSTVLILAPNEAAKILWNGVRFETISSVKNSGNKAITADHILGPSDHGKVLVIASGNPTTTITIPSAGVESNFKCDFIHADAGIVNFVQEDPGVSPTVYSPNNIFSLSSFGDKASIIRQGAAYFFNLESVGKIIGKSIDIVRDDDTDASFYSATNNSATNNQFYFLETITPNSSNVLKTFARILVNVLLREAGEEISNMQFQTIIGGVLATIMSLNAGGLTFLTDTTVTLGKDATSALQAVTYQQFLAALAAKEASANKNINNGYAGLTFGTVTLNFSGAFTANNVNIKWQKTGNIVNLTFPDILATATAGTILSSTALPANLRPFIKADCAVRITDNAVQPTASGLVRVRTDGIIEIYKDLNGASFTNGAAAGLQGGPIPGYSTI